MLTPEDIELMSRTYREEIASMREVPVILVREIEVTGDPFQGGTKTEEVDDDEPTNLVWVPAKATDSTTVINGVQIENGDVLATMTEPINNVIKARYGGDTYRIIARSPLGIGDLFRTELLLRKVT